jgi:FkbM family methyltransferase
LISLRQPSLLLGLSRDLNLGSVSTAKLFVAYYAGRRRAIGYFFPKMLTLDLPSWGKVPVRSNGYDHRLLLQLFVRKDYQMEAPEVGRILDLGANIGMSAVFLHQLFPNAEIACVEPSPLNVPVLKQAIAVNEIRGRVFEGAIGPEPGFVDLYLSNQPDRNTVIPTEPEWQPVRVTQFSVPQIMEQMGWDTIDVLKLDIEGGEKGILEAHGSWLNQVRYIIGESHRHVGYDYAALRADLEAFGFVLETLIPETEDIGCTFRAVNMRHPANAAA